jgi:hypothetical protein
MRIKTLLWVLLMTAAGMIALRCGTDRASDPGPGPDPETIKVELEGFTDKFDVPESTEISQYSCGGVSGGKVARGIDRVTEWLEVDVEVPEAGTYTVEVAFQGRTFMIATLRLTADDCGAGSEPEFTLEDGRGVG